MSDEHSKPVDDLKQGLGLILKAAKGAVEKLPTERLEDVVKESAKEVGKAFETVAHELDKVISKATGTSSSPASYGSQPPEPTTAEGVAEAKAQHDEEEAKSRRGGPPADDAYAPEPPKGPRVG